MAGRSGGRSGGGSRGSSGRSSGLGRGSSGRSMGSRGSAGRSLRSSNNNRSRSLGGHGGSGGSLFGGSSSFGGNTHHRNNSAGSFLGGYLMGKATSNRSSSRHHIPRHSHYDMGNRNHGSGCFTKLLLGAIVLFFLFFVFSGSLASCSQGYNYNSNTANSNKENITPNRTKREPLQKGFVKETEYYEDNLDWISNPTKLTIGLKNFYNLTGIQPYILLVDTIGSNPSDNDIDAYANRYYDNHFEDEAHLLFIYIDDIDYMYGIVGSNGLTVMDQEAWDILFDYV